MRHRFLLFFLWLSINSYAVEPGIAKNPVHLSDEEAASFSLTPTMLSCTNVQDSDNNSERTMAEIFSCINLNLESLKHAYSITRKNDPQLGGKLTVRFTINPDGSVAHMEKVGGDIKNNAEFLDLILKKLGNLRWKEKQVEPTAVRVPLVFVLE